MKVNRPFLGGDREVLAIPFIVLICIFVIPILVVVSLITVIEP